MYGAITGIQQANWLNVSVMYLQRTDLYDTALISEASGAFAQSFANLYFAALHTDILSIIHTQC